MVNLLTVFFISAVPVVEQRGAIPLGIMAGMDPYVVFFISLFGSLLPFPFIYFFTRPVFAFIRNKTRLGKWIDKIETRTLSKSDQIVKYKTLGLMLFVGIPLPGTGIWTGTLASVLLNLRFRYAFVSILGGAFMSAILITLGTTGIIKIF